MSARIPYYQHLAREQMDRYDAFCAAHPEMDRLERRHAFFGQRYEMNISYSIVRECDALLPSSANKRPDN